MIKSGRLESAKYLILNANKSYSSFLKNLSEINYKLNQLDKKISIKLIEGKESIIVSPVFRWAQSKTHIFLEIKYSSSFNSPVITEVIRQRYEFDQQSFNFTADVLYENRINKFILKLNFYHAINPNLSYVSSNSVGRVNANISKASPGMWDRLINATEKMLNMFVWWDLQEQLDNILNKEILANSSLEANNAYIESDDKFFGEGKEFDGKRKEKIDGLIN